MKKGVICFISVAIATAAILGACGKNIAIYESVPAENRDTEDSRTDASPERNPTAEEGFPLEIEDMLGNTVTIEKKPERIAVISTELYELFSSMGGTSVCFVESGSGDTAADDANLPPSVGQESNPDVISILELEPDLVIAEAVLQKQVISTLQKNEIKVIALKTEDAESRQKSGELLRVAAGLP